MTTTNQTVALADYQPHPRNYNRHGELQVQRIAASLQMFGQVRSVVVWRNYFLAGHGVREGALKLGWSELRADVLPDDYPEELALAYVAADNELGRLSDPDNAQLAQILEESKQYDDQLLAAIGYDDQEFDALLKEVERDAVGAEPSDSEPQISKADELLKVWQVQPGDLWRIGEHRLICGDCTDPATVARVMGGEKATSLMMDPPYGMSLDSSYSNSVDNKAKGAKASRGYEPVIGDNEDYDPLPVLSQFEYVKDQFWWGADYYRDRMPGGGSWLVWDKRASVEDVDYSSSEFELCWSKKAHHRKILRVPWFGIIGMEKQDTKLRVHPTQKPTQVYSLLMKECGGGVVFDGYGGSGSSMVAAQNLGVRCFVAELSIPYCAVILQRMADAFPSLPIERIDG